MSKKLILTATQLSNTFMPAERSQSAAAIQAAQSLIVALEARKLPEFANSVCDAALQALVRGISASVEADTALRDAHRKFAKIIGPSGLREMGWGCDSPDCEQGGKKAQSLENVQPIRAAA